MTRQMTCLPCRLPYTAANGYCSRCGKPLTSVPESTWHQWRRPVAITLLVVVIGIAAIESRNRDESPTSTGPTTASTQRSSATATKHTDQVDYSQALTSFKQKMLSVPDADQLFLSIENTPVPGVVRIQVSNAWFDFRPFQKRQLTQMIANLWSQELKGASGIVHIYDMTGREIAGTKAFGGVWVEDE